jgi:hypothetical protein
MNHREALRVYESVGAEYCVASCDLGVLVYEAAEPVSSGDLDVGVDRIVCRSNIELRGLNCG